MKRLMNPETRHPLISAAPNVARPKRSLSRKTLSFESLAVMVWRYSIGLLASFKEYVMLSRLSAATMIPSGTQTVITRDMNAAPSSTRGRRAAQGRAGSNAAAACSTVRSAKRRPTI